jgi:mannitol-1-phosphate 5-dehydrogenase
LKEHLPADFPFESRVGLVETSIGKMVPIMTEGDLATDPLWVFAEAYNTLIVDRRGFIGDVPALPGIKAVENINAYVDRKLFVHNLGHAATAYFGYEQDPAATYIWEPLTDRIVIERVTNAMSEAAAALNREYPEDLSREDLEEHIQDLLRRFANRALGDTIFRVGRDLYRKLDRDDRLVGACLLAARHGLPFSSIAAAVRAAVNFRGRDEHGLLFPGDRRFASTESAGGLENVLKSVCRLDPAEKVDSIVIAEILGK